MELMSIVPQKWKVDNGARITITFVFLCSVFSGTETIKLSEYVLDDGVASNCNEDITNKVSVILLSQPGAGLFGGLTSHKADQNCSVTFEVEDGNKILLQFPFFDLQPPSGITCIDKVVITELGDGSTDSTDICTDQDFVSVTDKIEIQFLSDSSIQKKGFKGVTASFHDAPCTDSEFLCDTNRCISTSLKCDGEYQCVDKSDESKQLAGCTLGDQIVNTVTGLGKYGLLALVGLVAVIFFTVLASIFVWKCSNSDDKCCQCHKSTDDDPEDWNQSPPTTSRGKKTSKLNDENNAKTKKGKKVTKTKVNQDDNVDW
ncbi:Suppressor of tumorigenicity 14 protein [Mactra antiquata]